MYSSMNKGDSPTIEEPPSASTRQSTLNPIFSLDVGLHIRNLPENAADNPA